MAGIEIHNVSKSFGPTRALRGLSLTVESGEIRALLGRNGAGKSTLIGILAGTIRPDAGSVKIIGGTGEVGGVGCVFQHSTLLPGLTAAENIALGAYPTISLGRVDWKAMFRAARKSLAEWDLGMVADTPVENLGPLECKIVEICRALNRSPGVLLLDEPTAGLQAEQTSHLFSVMRRLKERDVAIIYVSHHLDEVLSVCDTVTVLRDGEVVSTHSVAETTAGQLVFEMVGSNVQQVDAAATRSSAARRARGSHKVGESTRAILRARSLSSPGTFSNVSLEITRGECVGITGLEGAGHFEFAQAIHGGRPISDGELLIDGVTLLPKDEREALHAGIGFTPADRIEAGFVPGMSVSQNATMPILPRLASRLGVLNRETVAEKFRPLAEAWEIKAASPHQTIEELSGGNQQKVVLARALATDPTVLILANPTAGVDVAAKASIYLSIQALVQQGKAVLIVSNDYEDLAFCHRIVVFRKGAVVTELLPPYTEHQITSAMQGG